MHIAVGTKSEQKLGFVRELIKDIGLSAEILPCEANSEVSSQPISENETRTGSINRARSALSGQPSADAGLGIEVGYVPNDEGLYEIFCYATIIDRNGFAVSCPSHKFLLPKEYQHHIKNRISLGNHIKSKEETNLTQENKFLHNILKSRKPFIIESVRSALLRYSNRKLF